MLAIEYDILPKDEGEEVIIIDVDGEELDERHQLMVIEELTSKYFKEVNIITIYKVCKKAKLLLRMKGYTIKVAEQMKV